jgi:hypothetical protein
MNTALTVPLLDAPAAATLPVVVKAAAAPAAPALTPSSWSALSNSAAWAPPMAIAIARAEAAESKNRYYMLREQTLKNGVQYVYPSRVPLHNSDRRKIERVFPTRDCVKDPGNLRVKCFYFIQPVICAMESKDYLLRAGKLRSKGTEGHVGEFANLFIAKSSQTIHSDKMHILRGNRAPGINNQVMFIGNSQRYWFLP